MREVGGGREGGRRWKVRSEGVRERGGKGVRRCRGSYKGGERRVMLLLDDLTVR